VMRLLDEAKSGAKVDSICFVAVRILTIPVLHR